MEKKPYIAARLRNPTEEVPVKVKGTNDILGGIVAVLSFLVAIVTTAILYFDWNWITVYTG